MTKQSLNWIEAHPDGERLVIASTKGHLCLWDLQEGGLRKSLEVDDFIAQARWAPDGTRLFVAGRSGKVTVLTQDLEIVQELETKHRILPGLAVHPDGSCFATGGQDGFGRVWDAASYELLYEVGNAKFPARAVGLTDKALILGLHDDYFIAWHDQGKKVVAEGADFSWGISTLATSPSGDVIIFGGEKGSMFPSSAGESWKPIQRWRGTPPRPIAVNCLSFSKDGSHFVGSFSDDTAQVFDLSEKSGYGKTLGDPFYHRDPKPEWCQDFIVSGACFDQDKRWVLTCHSDGKPKLWEPFRILDKLRLTVTFDTEGAWQIETHDGRTEASDGTGDNKNLWATIRAEPEKK